MKLVQSQAFEIAIRNIHSDVGNWYEFLKNTGIIKVAGSDPVINTHIHIENFFKPLASHDFTVYYFFMYDTSIYMKIASSEEQIIHEIEVYKIMKE